ncbi:MAG TPA: hypothetical protein PKC28_05785 [Bdellovibrionales bacterium]|nr:hypothetical protein [Bdellovibrionales bacterium]
MRLFLPILMLVSGAAHAQWTLRMNNPAAESCPQEFKMGDSAWDAEDTGRNRRGRKRELESRRTELENKLEKLEKGIDSAKEGLRSILSGKAVQAVDQHRVYKRNADEYQEDCGVASTAQESADDGEGYAPGEESTGESDGQHAVPDVFCTKGGKNLWKHFVINEGQMDSRVCEYHIPVRKKAPASSDIRTCRRALEAYYKYMAQKDSLKEALEEISTNIADTEAGTCEDCEEKSLAENGIRGSFGEIAPMLGILGLTFLKNQMGGGQQQQPMMHPAMAYQRPMPGYYNPNGPMYGAMPSGVGPGAFACQGVADQSLMMDPRMNQQWFQDSPLLNSGAPAMFRPDGGGWNQGGQFGDEYNPYDPFNLSRNRYFQQYPQDAWWGANTGQRQFAPGIIQPIGNGQYYNHPGTLGGYAPSPVDNYYRELDRMRSNMNQLQYGPGYQGAPAVIQPRAW